MLRGQGNETPGTRTFFTRTDTYTYVTQYQKTRAEEYLEQKYSFKQYHGHGTEGFKQLWQHEPMAPKLHSARV